MLVLGRAREEEELARLGLERDDPLGQRMHVAGRELAGGDRGPGPLLVERQLRGVDVLPLARDDADPALRIVRHRDDPVGLLHDRPRGLAAASAAARRRRRHEAAGPVGVDVEQRVERDDPLGVRRPDLGEVDDDAGLLAPVQAHDPADPLLVHPPARGRREVHAHGRPRARSTPPRGSARSRARSSRRARRPPASRPARAAACGPRRRRRRGRSRASRPRTRSAWSTPGGVDDARRVAEPALVEVGGREVQRVDVEGCGQLALVEVAADDVDLPERRDRLHPHAPEGRDDAAADGLGEREVGDLGGEHVADVLLEQLVGRGHADVHGLREAADRRGRLLAERRVGLVADDDAVDVALDLVGVLDEPRVRVDRERRGARGRVWPISTGSWSRSP